MRRQHRQAGFTLIELMVAVSIASVAIYFIFTSYSRLSVAMHSQSRIAEVEQTVTSANDLMTRDLRAAGYLTSALVGVNPGLIPAGQLGPIRVTNGGGGYGSDLIILSYADLSSSAIIPKGSKPKKPSSETPVQYPPPWSAANPPFYVGEILVAVRIGGNPALLGKSCIIQVTQLNAGPKIQHNPGLGAGINSPTTKECDNIASGWSDGHTVFAKYGAHAYRIRPNDPRGILEVSPTGGLAAIINPANSDWQPLAMGVVDLQVALNVLDTATGVKTWYSGDNMNTVLDGTLFPTHVLTDMHVTIVARTTAEVAGPGTTTLPAISDPLNLNNNSLGDRPAIALTSTLTSDPNQPYFGNNAYRWTSTMVDMRNVGVGQ
jgi:prepilin-type N-terminal cleavage/methylation domain-containing protein